MQNPAAFTGNLNFLDFGDLLQLIGSSGNSGMLRLTSRYAPEPGFVYFVKGNPVDATNGRLTGIDALYAMFGWIDGDFEFYKESIARQTIINKSRMEIILDGLKMLDEGEIKKLGPLSLNHKPSYSFDSSNSLPLIRGPLVDYMYIVDEEDFFDGYKIVEEGKHGGWIWVILEGIVHIVKETNNGPVTILRIGPGAFIGSIASFLVRENSRGATAVAFGNVQLGVLDSQRLAREFAIMSPDFRQFVSSLDRRLKLITNRMVDIFLGNNSGEDFLLNKTPLVKQGDTDSGIVSIVRGQATVVRETGTVKVPLCNLNSGDFFGHIPFLNAGHEPHSAAVYASKDIETTQLDSGHLSREFKQLSSTFQHLIEMTATCISVTTMIVCEEDKKKN